MDGIGMLCGPRRAAAMTSVAAIGVPRGAEAIALESAVRRAALAVTDFSWLSRADRRVGRCALDATVSLRWPARRPRHDQRSRREGRRSPT